MAEGEDCCGNVRPNWDREAKRFVFKEPDFEHYGEFMKKHALMSEVISSALLLYRYVKERPELITNIQRSLDLIANGFGG